MSFELTYSDYQRAISIPELLKAANECRRGLMWKESVFSWWHFRLINVVRLNKKLLAGTYKLHPYTYFHVNDPKPRDICATKFVDRVVQRSLCNNGLYDAFVHPFIYDNFACQKGKGLTLAIKRLKHHLRQFHKEQQGNHGYFLKLDIKHYFLSTPHQMLKEVVSKHISEPHFQKHVFDIIDSFKDPRTAEEIAVDPFGKRGIGLGSQCSQLLQLLYLNSLDHYVKEQLKCRHYVRYMDDMIMLCRSKDDAKQLKCKIQLFLEKIGLQLNAKSHYGKIEDNIKFLKLKFTLSKGGSVRTKLCRCTVNREIRRLNKYQKLLDMNDNRKFSTRDLKQHMATWLGFAKWRASKSQQDFIRRKCESLS